MIVLVRLQIPDGGDRDVIASLLTRVAEDIKTGPYSRATWEVQEQSARLSYAFLTDADGEAWTPFTDAERPKK